MSTIDRTTMTTIMLPIWKQTPFHVFATQIMPYVIQKQPPELLLDIENYKKTMDQARVIYHDIDINTPDEWFIYNILQYANQGLPLSRVYSHRLIDIWHRHRAFSRKSDDRVAGFIARKFDNDDYVNYPPRRQIKIMWGLLLPEERTYIVENDPANEYYGQENELNVAINLLELFNEEPNLDMDM